MTLTHCHSHVLSHILLNSITLTHCYTHTLSHTVTHTVHSHTITLTITHTVTLTYCHTHYYTCTLSHSHTVALVHCRSHILSQSYSRDDPELQLIPSLHLRRCPILWGAALQLVATKQLPLLSLGFSLHHGDNSMPFPDICTHCHSLWTLPPIHHHGNPSRATSPLGEVFSEAFTQGRLATPPWPWLFWLFLTVF